MSRVIVVIPARGGSKGIPRKNLAPFGKGTLLSRAVATVQAAGFEAWVSTEDAGIKSAAVDCGARVIDRPAELATDGATTDDVLIHAAYSLWAIGEQDLIVCIVCTAPFLEPDDIRGAVNAYQEGPRPGCEMAVRTFSKFLWRYAGEQHTLQMVNLPFGIRPMRQDWPEIQCVETGLVHVVSGADLVRAGTRVITPVRPYYIPEERSLDIDSPEDLEYARWLLARREAK
jgi:N-acylneuraminate cytidylyltransferase